MKPKVLSRIPGKKATIPELEKTLEKASEEAAKAEAPAAEEDQPESRESPDDKILKAEARKAFEATVRGKLKYSKKR